MDSRSIPQEWVIFCRVVDNFGDAGVSWRLARQLALEPQRWVSLVIDQPGILARFEGSLQADAEVQYSQGVRVVPWEGRFEGHWLPSLDNHRPLVVIAAFGCDLPLSVVVALAQRPTPVEWIVLEYLSAEAWVEGCHGLSSTLSGYEGSRHFFFPGFTPATGGLFREPGLLEQRDRFQASAAAQHHLRQRCGLEAETPYLTLFAYPAAPWRELLTELGTPQLPTCWVLFDGTELAQAVAQFVQRGPDSVSTRYGNVLLHWIPLQSPAEYDHLLWAAECNVVRGEDSFLRAQWAGKPFIWHIYPQAEGAHEVKLEAFLQRYLEGLESAAAQAVAALFWAWNGRGAVGAAWQGMAPHWEAWRAHGREWSERLATQEDLVTRLADFVGKRL